MSNVNHMSRKSLISGRLDDDDDDDDNDDDHLFFSAIYL